jgi:hypothetical protein
MATHAQATVNFFTLANILHLIAVAMAFFEDYGILIKEDDVEGTRHLGISGSL